MGLELHMVAMEFVQLLTGGIRVEMLVHHLLCVVLVIGTVAVYVQLPSTDVVTWRVVWDSISRMLVSSFPLHLRYFYSENVPFNLAFAASFLYCRVLEQIPFASEIGQQVGAQLARTDADAAWHSPVTWVVVVAWGLLSLLNLVWSVKVVRAVMYKSKAMLSTKTKAVRR